MPAAIKTPIGCPRIAEPMMPSRNTRDAISQRRPHSFKILSGGFGDIQDSKATRLLLCIPSSCTRDRRLSSVKPRFSAIRPVARALPMLQATGFRHLDPGAIRQVFRFLKLRLRLRNIDDAGQFFLLAIRKNEFQCAKIVSRGTRHQDRAD